MSIKVAKIIRITLLVISCIAFWFGITISKAVEEKIATDVSKISVQVTEKDCHYNPNGNYCIKLTYRITNNTKTNWRYLKVTTYVYDVKGKSLGTIISEFGSSYDYSDLELKVGDTVTKLTSLKANQPDIFFETLYNSALSELKFKSEVEYGTHYN